MKKKYPVEVWTKDEKGEKKDILAESLKFVAALTAQSARDTLVAELTKTGTDIDTVIVEVCAPLPLATA